MSSVISSALACQNLCTLLASVISLLFPFVAVNVFMEYFFVVQSHHVCVGFRINHWLFTCITCRFERRMVAESVWRSACFSTRVFKSPNVESDYEGWRYIYQIEGECDWPSIFVWYCNTSCDTYLLGVCASVVPSFQVCSMCFFDDELQGHPVTKFGCINYSVCLCGCALVKRGLGSGFCSDPVG